MNSVRQTLRILSRFDLVVARYLGRLGEKVARSPGEFIIISLLTSALFATGLLHLNYESDPEYLFVPSDARAHQERHVLSTFFPTNFSRFTKGTENRQHMACEISVLPKYGKEIMRQHVWKEAYDLAQAIKHIQIKYDGDLYSWRKLCVRFKEKCVENDFLQLHDVLHSVNITYPLMEDERFNVIYPMLAHVGGVHVDGNLLKSAHALKLTFIIDDATRRKKLVGELWTQVVRSYVSSINYKYIQVHAVTDKSIEMELSNAIESSLDKIPLTIILVLSFSIYNCLSSDWVRSKPLIGVLGLLLSVVSAASGFGMAMYLGIKWQAINLVGLYLVMGIGMDDTFVMLSAWWRTETQGCRDVVARISMTFSDAAVSITITSLTNIISFMAGAAIPGFPCVQIFCLYTGIALVFLYFWTLTVFGGFLTLAGHMEHSNKHCLLFVRVCSKTEAEEKRLNWLYSLFLQGGISKKEPLHPRDNKEGKMMVFFRDSMAPFINNFWTKMFILITFLSYLGLSIWGVLHLEEGLERSKLVGDHSYTIPFFQSEDRFFRDHPYRFQILINEPLDYSNQSVQTMVKNLIHQFEDSRFVTSDPAYRQSWLHTFLDTAERNFLFFDLSTPALFMENLRKFMKELKSTPLYDDVVFSEDGNTILASRFCLQSSKINNAKDEVDMLKELRQIADSAPFNVTIFHNYFGFFDQFAQVKQTTYECVIVCCLCMSVITFMFIPNKICVIWVTFTILSVELGVIGFMPFLGISLDVISMIVLIMGIGFSVDFSAHISYHFLSSGAELPPKTRLAHCLHGLGPPIVRGGTTTLLSVVGLLLHPSYVTRTFAKMIFLIIILGVLHGLILLPVLLTLFGPGTAKPKKAPHKSDGGDSASDITLSETFVYQATISPRKSKDPELKKKTNSLRRMVLKGNKLVTGDPENINYTGCLYDRSNTEVFNKRKWSDDAGSDTKAGRIERDLPYYNFAHIKRSAIISRLNSGDSSPSREKILGDSWNYEFSLPTGNLEELESSYSSNEDFLDQHDHLEQSEQSEHAYETFRK